jgi:hypothetical protein
MKKLVIFPLFLILFFAGCQKDTSLVSLEQNDSKSLQKPAWVLAAEKQGLTLIALPQSSSLSLEKKIRDTEFIKHDEFGKLSIENVYRSTRNNKVSVEASLSIRANSLAESGYLSMSFVNEFLCFEFGPSGTTFSKDALLNVEAEGLDRSTLEELKTAKLNYFDETTKSWIEVGVDEISVRDGKFVCKNGKIPHFSRYGFTN